MYANETPVYGMLLNRTLDILQSADKLEWDGKIYEPLLVYSFQHFWEPLYRAIKIVAI
jgi:hypothetical protein